MWVEVSAFSIPYTLPHQLYQLSFSVGKGNKEMTLTSKSDEYVVISHYVTTVIGMFIKFNLINMRLHDFVQSHRLPMKIYKKKYSPMSKVKMSSIRLDSGLPTKRFVSIFSFV